MRQVWNTVAQFHMLEPGDRVLLGVSGGPDSVALLHLLHSKAEEYGITLHVVHVNHQLRAEADGEEAFVRALAEQYNVPFRSYCVDVAAYAKEQKLSLEQAGHVVRFQCFLDAKEHWDINKLALGHHKDDRAESILMHVVQGCGLDGIAAMPPVDLWHQAEIGMIRPLAQVTKAELEAYCLSNQLQYCVDATNFETDYLRNRIRLALLPELRAYNPQITDALVRMQELCSAELDYLESQVSALWEQYGVVDETKVQFPADVFRTQHVAIQRRLLRRLYQAWVGSTADLSFAQTEQMRMIAQKEQGSQEMMLANQVVFMRQYDVLSIARKASIVPECETYTWNIAENESLSAYQGLFTVEWLDGALLEKNNDFYTIFADGDQLASLLEVRTRKVGDRLQPMGMQGHKTVKKFMIDQKVPQKERDGLPMVLSNNEIVWIPGYFMADCIKITKHTKTVCKLCFSSL